MVNKMSEEKKQRVVITGMGVVCPLGHTVEELWQSLMTGKSGAAKTTTFDASTFPTTFSAEVKNYNLSSQITKLQLHKDADRGSVFALGATAQACRQAGIDIETDNFADGIDRTKMGIYLGAGEGSVDNDVFFNAIVQSWDNENQKMDWGKWAQIAFSKMSPMYEFEQETNMPSAHIAMLTGARGPTRNCLTACAASTQAIGEATRIIRRGDADIMIAGGAHSMIHPLGVSGFNRLTALSTRNDSPQTASRPFSATRDGFVIGEGAAILILESLESAKRRGVKILAEITGYGSTSDAFRVTDMHEDGRGAIQAMNEALKDAGITYKDIDYVNPHGTSTAENDAVETKAIKTVFQDNAKKVPVSSMKSLLGHLIAAAGASEAIICVLAMHKGIIPATMNLNDPDPELDLDYVPNVPRKYNVNMIMKESFGFGGQNNVVIIKRYEN